MPGNDSTQKALAHLRSQSGNQDLSLEQAKKGVKLGIPGMAGYLRDDGTIAYVTVMDTVQRYAKPMQKKDEAAIRAYFEREADKSPEEREWEKKQREKGWVQVEPDVWKKKPGWVSLYAEPNPHGGTDHIPEKKFNEMLDEQMVVAHAIREHDGVHYELSEDQRQRVLHKLAEDRNFGGERQYQAALAAYGKTDPATTKYRKNLLPKNWTGRDN